MGDVVQHRQRRADHEQPIGTHIHSCRAGGHGANLDA